VHFAVAGCGVISRFHLDAIRSIEDAALCGVYDPVEASARAAAQAYGTRAYPDYDALLADPQVDAVCICTPSHLHAPLALQAVAAGKHVLIEKPVALTLEDCDAVAAAARAAGVQVGVVSQLRYGPAVARVKRALESGALGRITRCDLYMKYFRPQSYYDSGTWRGTQAMDGGGALMNQGIHGVDLVRYLMGPADSIYALSGTLVRDIEVEDTLTAVVAWHCGAQGVIQASVGDYPGFPRRIELNGESGTIILEEDRIVKWEVAGDSAYHIYEQEPAPEVRSHSEAGAIDPSGHVAQLRNFIDAVRGEGQPVLAHLHLGCDVHDAQHALDNIVDVGEVAATVAHVEDLDDVAAAQLLGEAEIGHIGPAHGAVHREEAQASRRDGIELGVGGGHELVGLLGGGVERDRRVDSILLGERHLLVAAVDRARAGVD